MGGKGWSVLMNIHDVVRGRIRGGVVGRSLKGTASSTLLHLFLGEFWAVCGLLRPRSKRCARKS